MTTAAVAKHETAQGLAPLSLKETPSFIEAQFPVGRVSAEAYKERQAGRGQTLPALGSYWKGRKPLILVRAVVLGSLLPTTDDPAKDLEIFLKVMAMDDAAFGRRFDGNASLFAGLFPSQAELATEEKGSRRIWREDLSLSERQSRVAEAFAKLPYADRLVHVRRPEECDESELLAPIWEEVNVHLGTTVRSLPALVEQLGVARFGHRPRAADTFCGGGSIPFEAARLGCEVYASDLNPIACMLTWGAFNIIGANPARRAEIETAQKQVALKLDEEISRLGIEHDKNGNRAKSFLYCLETRCPKTGWMVPIAPSWIISKRLRIAAKLVPIKSTKRYSIEVQYDLSADEMAVADQGTVRDGRLVHPMNPERSGVEIKVIRGDYRDADGNNRNRLRLWEKSDFVPRLDDIFQERLYCIQWITQESIAKGRQDTFFAAVTEDDLIRERQVEQTVRDHLSSWQDEGLVPDMAIERGDETSRLFRERGWTYWHHLFNPRDILALGQIRRLSRDPSVAIAVGKQADFQSKLVRWDQISLTAINAMYNQALNTNASWATRSTFIFTSGRNVEYRHFPLSDANRKVETLDAKQLAQESDLFVTDPPYADAVNYQEITEYFIAWLRKNPPPPFDQWIWDSRRDLAIKGKDEHFRRDMVAAYAAMTQHMPDNGIQVVMFTHQDAGVWADLGGILWAAGLRVTAAWNVVTETESALKEGNYVQGTVCLVLRKRVGKANARRMEIEAEIEEAVAAQLSRLTALDDTWHERANAETLYTDGDLTLAAYAAALRVVTSYSSIDRQPLDSDLYRKLDKGERTMIRDLVDYAAQVANGLLVPTGFPREAWRDLGAPERFYVRMLDMEAKGATKVADFQNFAKSFAYGDYTSVMASTAANAASLAGATDLEGKMLDGEGFAKTQLRQVLFAVWKTFEKGDPKLGVMTLRTEYPADYWQRRQKLIGLAEYVAAKTKSTRPSESAAAHELAEALKLDRV